MASGELGPRPPGLEFGAPAQFAQNAKRPQNRCWSLWNGRSHPVQRDSATHPLFMNGRILKQ
eukprot:15451494-Alexandrium_andersonii.AAC.1